MKKSFLTIFVLVVCSSSPPVSAAEHQLVTISKTPTVTSDSDSDFLVSLSAVPQLDYTTTLDVDYSVSDGWIVDIVDLTEDGSGLPPFACGSDSELPELNVRLSRDPTKLEEENKNAKEIVILKVIFMDQKRRNYPSSNKFIFRVQGSELVPVGFDKYFDSTNIGTIEEPALFMDEQELRGAGISADLPPWENEVLPEFVREHLRSEYERSQQQEIETTQNGLQASTDNLDTPDELAGGCTASRGAGLADVGLIGYLLAIFATLAAFSRARKAVVASIALLCLFPTPSKAESRSVWGYLSFWDTRDGKYDEPGNRMGYCDNTDYSCDPWDNECCFSGIPRVTISLNRLSDHVEVDSSMTDEYGVYLLTDTNWQDQSYYITITFHRDGYPLSTYLTSHYGTSGIKLYSGQFTITSSFLFKSLSVNSAGDTTSTQGDLASIWTSIHDGAYWVTEENELRIRREHQSINEYDDVIVRYYNFSNPSDPPFTVCNTQTINISYGNERNYIPGHELGHILHGRVVGCNGGVPAFPPRKDDPWRSDTAEGNAFHEGIASFVWVLMQWDPDVALTSDMIYYDECYEDADFDYNRDCCNMLSISRHNCYAIWELIDSSTANTAFGYSDSIDITLEDFYDGLVSLQNTPGTQGQNWTADEVYQQCTYLACSHSDTCGDAGVCFADLRCWSGDLHGSNLRDIVHHIYLNLGLSETSLWHSFASNPCVGGWGNSSPYTGGFHSD